MSERDELKARIRAETDYIDGRAPIQPVATQEDAGNVQARFNKWKEANVKYVEPLDCWVWIEQAFKDGAASQPSNAAEPFAFYIDDEDGDRIYNGHNQFPGGRKGKPLYAAATVPPVGVPSGMADELLRIARLIEALKKPCGTDPESPQAIRNGQYQSIALMVRSLLTTASNAGNVVPAAIDVRDAALEEAAKEFDRRDNGSGGFYDPAEPAEIIRALQSTTPAEPVADHIRDATKMMPTKPTEKMIDAAVAFGLNVSLYHGYGWTEYMKELYATFLVNAPTQPMKDE